MRWTEKKRNLFYHRANKYFRQLSKFNASRQLRHSKSFKVIQSYSNDVESSTRSGEACEASTTFDFAKTG